MAIAFDAASGDFVNPGTSLTFSHTCSGSDRFLVVGVTCDPDTPATGVTFNGDAMTLQESHRQGTTRVLQMWVLNNPDAATGDIVVTGGTNAFIGGTAASYTGVNQTGQPEVEAEEGATADTLEVNITTSTDNAWTVMVGKTEAGSIGAGASTTKRDDDGIAITGIFDSNGAITPAGATALTFTSPSSQDISGIIISLAPSGAAATTSLPPRHRAWRFFQGKR